MEAGGRRLVRDRERVLDRHLRHHDKPALRRARDVDVDEVRPGQAPRKCVGLCQGRLRAEDAVDLARVVRERRRRLLERDGETGLACLVEEARALGLRVRAVDLDLEVAAAVVLDLDPGEADLPRSRSEALRERIPDRRSHL